MRAAFCVPAGSSGSRQLPAAVLLILCAPADCLPLACRLSAMWLLSGKNAKLRSDAMCLLSALRGPPAPACACSSNPWCMGMPRLLPCRPFSSILDRLRGQSIFSSVGLLGFPQTQPPACNSIFSNRNQQPPRLQVSISYPQFCHSDSFALLGVLHFTVYLGSRRHADPFLLLPAPARRPTTQSCVHACLLHQNAILRSHPADATARHLRLFPSSLFSAPDSCLSNPRRI